MTYIPVENVARISLVYSYTGQVCANTLHALRSAGWDISTLSGLAIQMEGWFNDYLKLHMSSELSLTQINCIDLTSDSAPSYYHTPTSPIPGGVTEASVAANVACVISWRTAQRGRSFRGRMYVPAMRYAYLDDAVTMTASAVSWLAVAAANLQGFLDEVAAEHVVVSRYHDKAPRAAGVATLVESYVVDNKVDSMRRRLSGRGI